MKDLTGQVFGKLIALRPVGKNAQGNFIWECLCNCGKLVEVASGNLQAATRQCLECARGNSRKRPYEAIFLILKRRNPRMSLTYEQFLQFTNISRCHYCFADIRWQRYNKQNYSRYNLDRKDNDLGYSNENCVVCCKRCNVAKSDKFTYEEWWRMTKIFRE